MAVSVLVELKCGCYGCAMLRVRLLSRLYQLNKGSISFKCAKSVAEEKWKGDS
jgi:hypothetical protein